ncbi:MAG: glycoside hydrolase family 97 protein [Lacibacter sp.]
MRNLSLFAILMLFVFINTTAKDVLSPSGKIKVSVSTDEKGQPFYTVQFNNITIIQPSKLGFVLKGNNDFYSGFEIKNTEEKTVDETWNPVWGEAKTIRNFYNQLTVKLNQKTTGRQINLVFRVFNDGVGFRYEFPQQANLNHFVVMDEMTQFGLGADHTAYWIPGDYDTNEYYYTTTKLSGIESAMSASFTEISSKAFFDKNAVQTPLMLKTNDGIYVNIFEAALVNYPAMNVVLDKSSFTLNAHLVPDAVGNKAYLQAPFSTPWRTIIVSDKATDVVGSAMIVNLNEPCKITDPSWIKPQKMIGVWWEMHVGKSSWDYSGGQVGSQQQTKVPHGANTANVKRYIDFAARNGFEGVLVEGWNTGWEDWFGNWKEDVFDFVTPYPDYDVNELSRYAKEKGVKIIMHHETSASVTNYERWMDTAYRFMKNHGMDAVKTGYVGYIIPRGEHHDGQWMINHYNRVIKKTASYKIMLDEHEPVRPTGLHRTWPNLLACEAARGNEFNAWSRGNPPEHETILPFTRLMGGPMDYTPGIFKIKMNYYNPSSTYQVHTTLTKQLALYVTMFSPLQMAADLPENYEARPDAFQFIKDVPVDWDDSKYLLAEPGDYLVVARKEKNKENWFLGAITDEQARNFTVQPGFLNANQKYVATIYRDADNASWNDNPEAYVIEKFVVTNTTNLKLKLAAGGGCAISIKPASAEEIKSLKKYK